MEPLVRDGEMFTDVVEGHGSASLPLEKPEKAPVVIPVKEARAPVPLDERGIVCPSDLEGLYRVATMLIKARALPAFLNNPEKVIVAHQLCRAYDMELVPSARNLCEINGSFSFWGELPLAVVMRSGQLEKIHEFLIDKDYKEICFDNKNLESEFFAAICVIKRRGREEKSFAFTTKDASKANKGIAAIWKGYDYIMYKRKARSIALKDTFPDVLSGMPIAEYDHERTPEIPESMGVNPETGKTLNEELKARMEQ